LIGAVFTVQLGLIFWLGTPQPRIVRQNDFAPGLRVVSEHAPGDGVSETLALNDPTLFALPHAESFSGLAWLRVQEQDFRPTAGSDPPYFLALNRERLGQDFKEFMATNVDNAQPILARKDFDLKAPVINESFAFPTQSMFRVTGGLVARRLTAGPELPSWPAAEILSNSVVQVLVAASGETLSATLLKPGGSGSPEADQYALREARKSRFERVDSSDPLRPLDGLTQGQMIFEWHTVTLPQTNSLVVPAPQK
jgi:hypothetical protein